MKRNTTLLIFFLAVLAAIVVGVNIGKSNSQPSTSDQEPSITPQPSTFNPQLLSYTDDICGVTLMYPETMTKVDIQTGGATLVDTQNATNSITLVCQKEIPRVPLPKDKIEDIQIGTVSANLYHDASQKDGTPVDKLIFTHPKTKQDVYLAGYGETFNKILQTLSVNF